MQKLLIATGNQGKFCEIKDILAGLPLQFVSLTEAFVDMNAFVEDGETYVENAAKKARFCARESGLMTVADDSGIIVEALSGELGVKTRRWGAGEKVSDKEWIDFFMNRMEREDNRKAKFVCYACLADKDGNVVKTCVGETSGKIMRRLQAPILHGLPLSSLFLADGTSKVYAALGAEEKNRISHRGKAFMQMKEFFEKNIPK